MLGATAKSPVSPKGKTESTGGKAQNHRDNRKTAHGRKGYSF